MHAESVAEMSFDEWMNRNGKFGAMNVDDMSRELKTTQPVHDKLSGAVAYFLYIASKDVPDDEGGLYRAAALQVVGLMAHCDAHFGHGGMSNLSPLSAATWTFAYGPRFADLAKRPAYPARSRLQPTRRDATN